MKRSPGDPGGFGPHDVDVFRFLHCNRCAAKRYHTRTSIPGETWSCNVCKTLRGGGIRGSTTEETKR